MSIWKKWRIKWNSRAKKTLGYLNLVIDKLEFKLIWWRKEKVYFKYLEFEFSSYIAQ